MTSLRFVVLRTQSAENLGACARALRNCGFSDWVHVDRQVADVTSGRHLAVHAEELLAAARVETTLGPAIEDCVWVVGTSSRIVRGKRRLTPREVATEAASRLAQGPVALVFGDERSGLRAEEIDRCHDLSFIPADAAQPSFNLAQAVLLYAYEARMAIRAAAATAATPAPLPRAADDATLERLHLALGGLLSEARFLRDERDALTRLFATLRRSRLSQREAALWLAALETTRKRLLQPR